MGGGLVERVCRQPRASSCRGSLWRSLSLSYCIRIVTDPKKLAWLYAEAQRRKQEAENNEPFLK
jgi:hypothetical protein